MAVNLFGIIIYFLWLCFSVFLFLLANNVGTLMIGVLTVLLPLFFVVGAKIAASKTEISFRIKGKCHRGEQVKGVAVIRNNSIFPASNVRFTLRCGNLMNGTVKDFVFDTDVPARGERELPFTFTAAHVGQTRLSVEKAHLTDLLFLGRFSLPKAKNAKGAVTVLPTVFPCQTALRENAELMPDSDIYSMHRAGNDIGEIYNIREYRPGDEIRYIHWKLSQKVDKLMVKELGYPIQNNVLLLLDTSFDEKDGTPSPAQIDALADGVYSVAAGLVGAEQPFTFAHVNARLGQTEFAEITEERGAEQALDSILTSRFIPCKEGEGIFYGSELSIRQYQHIAVLSLNKNADFSVLFNSNCVNCYMLSDKKEEDVALVGVTMHFFTVENYKDTLGIVEL